MTDDPLFICPRCGARSHHPTDAAERYCGACHAFVDDAEVLDPMRAVRLLRAKAAHLEHDFIAHAHDLGPLDWANADIALLASLLADEIERIALLASLLADEIERHNP